MRKLDQPQRAYTQQERQALMRVLRKDAASAKAQHKDRATQEWALRRAAKERGTKLNPADESLLL